MSMFPVGRDAHSRGKYTAGGKGREACGQSVDAWPAGNHNRGDVPRRPLFAPLRPTTGNAAIPPPNHALPTREVCHEEVSVTVSRRCRPAGRIVRRAPGPGRRQAAEGVWQPDGLERDWPLPVWGWADPGEEVTVELDEATGTVKADAQGNWRVVLPAVKADGKAHRMTVSGKNKIELDDILIGEVWLGSGQSNMEMGLMMCQKGREEVAAANHPNIRLLSDPRGPRGQGAGQGREKPVGAVPTGHRCGRRLERASPARSTISACGCTKSWTCSSD